MSAIAGRVLLMPQGVYDPLVTYSPLDYVSYGVSSYVCKKESLGNVPTNTEYWQILAKGLSSISPEALGIGYGVSADTGVGTAKTATLANYVITPNGLVAVTFADNVPANATLNINSQGAKPIYYRGAAIVANVIRGGDTVTFAYDGTNYNVLCIDGGAGHAIENSAGTELTQRDVMQFVDIKASDDSVNEKTKIEMIQEVTAAQLVNAGDGAYIVTDEDEVYLSAQEMEYDHTQSGLVAMNVQDAIDEVVEITDDLTDSNNEKADQILLAPVEPALVASQNYTSGQQFVYQGLLYKFTSNVSQGAEIVIGTNCALAEKITEQIDYLKERDVSNRFTSNQSNVFISAKLNNNNTVTVNLSAKGSFGNGAIIFYPDASVPVPSRFRDGFLGIGQIVNTESLPATYIKALANIDANGIFYILYEQAITANIVEFSVTYPLS